MQDNGIGRGSFEILSLENGKVVWQSEVMPNLILDTFWSLLIDHLAGDDSNPLAVTTLEVGTGDEPVTAADTALEELEVDNIPPAKTTPSAKSIQFEFFIVDAEMPDDTYRELGLRAGSTLITRALFTTPYVKISGRDTIIRYTLSFDSV